MNPDIPSAKDIDYGNADEICGYRMLLGKIYESSGGFAVDSALTKEIITVRREGLAWLKNVRKVIDKVLESPVGSMASQGVALGDIPRILASYDFLHRVCHGAPCFAFIRETALKVADRRAKGDKSISMTWVALMLLKEIDRDIRSLPKRYIDFSMSVLSGWIDDLMLYGRLRNMPLEEAYPVLGYILWQNLSAFDVKKDDKIRWIETYSLSDTALDRLDVRTLWTYMDFDQRASSFMGKIPIEQDERYARFIQKISAHQSTNKFTKELIKLELAKYRAA